MNLFEKMSPVVEMDAGEPLSKALNTIKTSNACVVITKNGKYVGIADDRSIEKVTSDPSTTKLGTVLERAPVIATGSSLMDVCKGFFTGPYKSLPVAEGEKIVGVLTRSEVIAELLAEGVLVGSVNEYMTSPVVTVDEKATIAQAVAKMRERGVRRLVIYSDGKLKGLLSTYDLKATTSLPKEHAPFAREKHSTEDALVSSLMTAGEDVVAIGPGATLAEAAKKMAEAGVAALVVTEKERPIGLLSARDIFESIMFQEKTPVYISGLGYEERMMVDEIRGEIEKELEKIQKSVPLDYFTMHFKKYGHKYSIHARLKTARAGILSASNFGFELQGTVHGLMAELRKITLGKLKSNPMHETQGKRF